MFIFCLCVYVPVPSNIGAHCPYFSNGYGIQVVWERPYGVWTSVEVTVGGQNHTIHRDAEQSLNINGFQPATTHQVSVTVLSASPSGPPSRSEVFVFSCLTDPRGECRNMSPSLNCNPRPVCCRLRSPSNPDLTSLQESLQAHFSVC